VINYKKLIGGFLYRCGPLPVFPPPVPDPGVRPLQGVRLLGEGNIFPGVVDAPEHVAGISSRRLPAVGPEQP